MSKTSGTIALMAGVLIVLAMTAACATGGKSREVAQGAPQTVQTKCPVTGDPINKKFFVEKDGKRIYLCCRMCMASGRRDFDAYAAKYEAQGIDLTIPHAAAPSAAKTETAKSKTEAPTAPGDEKIVYTCPMHPEVTSDKPGKCPKCGIDLVPKKPAGKETSERSGSPMSCCG